MIVENGVLKDVNNKDIELLKNEPDKFWEGVVKIGKRAFWYVSNLQEIAIPDGVERIGDGAFAFCKNLKEITIPSSIKSIGKFAFWGCDSLEKISIPKKVERIGQNFVTGCKRLKAVKFENKYQLPSGLKLAMENSDFKTYEISGDEITFIREIENKKEQNSCFSKD